MKILKSLLICSAVAVAAVALSGCQSAQTKTVSFKEVFKPEFTGMNGNATMDYTSYLRSADEEKYEKTLLGDVKTAELDSKKLTDYNRAKSTVDSFLNSVYFTIDSSYDKYTNEDAFMVTVTYNKELAEVLNVDVKDTEFKYVVKDLKEGTKINPFDKIKVSFSGMNGNGDISVDKSECPDFVKDYVYFEADNRYNLSNNDKVKLTASYSQYDAESKEVVITQDTKEYTVSGLTSYASTMDGVDYAELQTKFDAEAKDNTGYTVGDTAYTDDYSSIKVTSVKVTPYKKLFFSNTDAGYYSTHNSFDSVYEIEIQGTTEYNSSSFNKIKYKKGQTVTVKQYMSVYLEDLVVDENNKLVLSDDPYLRTSNKYNTYKDLTDRFQEYYGSKFTMNEIN